VIVLEPPWLGKPTMPSILKQELVVVRIAAIIVALTAIAVGLVHIRRAEVTARYEAQRFRLRQAEIRRILWDQEVRLGDLTAPGELRRRASELSIDLSPGRERNELVRSSAGESQLQR
jgi:neutral trehalase